MKLTSEVGILIPYLPTGLHGLYRILFLNYVLFRNFFPTKKKKIYGSSSFYVNNFGLGHLGWKILNESMLGLILWYVGLLKHISCAM